MAKHQYTILSMMKDEGHSLVEWVAYHKHIGFDNICVYTNNCGDGTDKMLERLQELGWVQHFENEVPEGKKPQPNALALATQNEEVMDSEWILTMDADEFLSIKVGRGWINDVVERMDPKADAMAITWRFFGANDVTDWNPGLVIENYTRAAPDMFKKGWGVKTLFKPYRDIKLGIHRPHIKKAKQEPANAKLLFDQLWVNGSGDPMPDEFSLSGWRSTKPTLGYKMVELNHYAVKSYEAYLLRRVRGNVNNKEDKYNAAYFALFDRNEEEHLNATRHAKGTKRKMAQILSDPIMRDLQDKALEFHAARVEMLRTSGEYDTWIKDLKEASAVELDKLDEVLFVQHLPKEWQQKVKELQAAGIPDKKIAKMIAQTQTAKKGDTRKALLEAAGENAEDKLDAHQLKDKSSKGGTLDNPFMNTEAAAGLGVPLMNERTQKIALAAQAADPNDAASAKLMAKAAVAKRAMAATTAPEVAPTTATIDMDEPAPSIGDIIEEATLEASTTIESPSDTVPIPDDIVAKPVKKAAPKKTAAKKPAAKKPAAKKPAARKTPAKKPAAKKTAATKTKVAPKKATPK
ncbi:glycosyltransferase family 2 protein [Octadecabacter sp. G9-8]|uniref:Glycosyltransferase family 2 protein n=1 Tax=Octadecabacter dasysiphoniae TaxID=2909341 RepID=A0ABS9CT94_9RHOB|nr:glycosyltransferase family 2 protein [Octadecabacter dasysiphoniae]MCF2870460.1 glycosyltransferase family 2 protein [Octadecabacter dasysiphoniae]